MAAASRPVAEVRAALASDSRAVAQTQVASWQAAYAGTFDAAFLAGLSVERREATWRRVLAAADPGLLLACEGDAVLGFASFGAARDQDAPPGRGELYALYVQPAAWSTGTGRALWCAARARLQSRGFTSVSLWVLEGNARAIRFYTAAGFRVEAGSARELEMGGSKVREVRMVHADPGSPPGNKTRPTPADVEAHIAARASEGQRADCHALLAMLEKVTQHGPRMWGPSIVGFGSYRYRYASGRTGESCLTGFAIRGRELVVYLAAQGAGQAALLARLGPHRAGKSCLYFKRLADLDPSVLEQLVAHSVAELQRRHGA